MTSSSLDLRETAVPQAVAVLRRRARRWLAEIDCDTDAGQDLVLAVSEALENVVDHAFVDAAEPGTITLRAEHDGGRATVVISDDGRWRPRHRPRPEPYRGRGLSLIDQLAGHSTVETGPTGTTVTLSRRC